MDDGKTTPSTSHPVDAKRLAAAITAIAQSGGRLPVTDKEAAGVVSKLLEALEAEQTAAATATRMPAYPPDVIQWSLVGLQLPHTQKDAALWFRLLVAYGLKYPTTEE